MNSAASQPSTKLGPSSEAGILMAESVVILTPYVGGEQISCQPSSAHVLAEDFHYPAIGTEVIVGWKSRFHENPVCGFENRI